MKENKNLQISRFCWIFELIFIFSNFQPSGLLEEIIHNFGDFFKISYD